MSAVFSRSRAAWYTLVLVTAGTGGGIYAIHRSQQTEREVSMDVVSCLLNAWVTYAPIHLPDVAAAKLASNDAEPSQGCAAGPGVVSVEKSST